MPVQKLQVFIAGRFVEFAELRHTLRDRINAIERPSVSAIDLDDNRADSHPPTVRCYQAIESADIVVLLVGQTYGKKLPDLNASYTHLEYRHALGDRRTIIPYYIAPLRDEPSDPDVRAWLSEIEGNQTVGRLDLALGYERLASDVFAAVFGRLWEIADESDVSPDDDDDSVSGRDESPIKREELNTLPRTSPLKALAAAHAGQAFEALGYGLPETAVDQLQRAVDLSPLEFVPVYWLARLLIATGRFADCRKGLRLALRCSSVASQKEDRPDLAIMASLILAARASERLGDSEAALRSAEEAHNETPWHWLAKFELGRQCALNGAADEALRWANDAFWLRPDTIQKIQGDPAYRNLGQPFDDFRRQLRNKVESETEEILRVEIALRELRVKPRDEVAPTRSAPEDGRKPSLLHIVRLALLSSRRSLQLMRDWAMALAGEVQSFAVGGFNGLTELTKGEIERLMESESENVASLGQNLTMEEEVMASAGRKTLGIVVAGLIVALLVGLGIWNSASNANWSAFGGFIALMVVVLFGFGAAANSVWSSHKTAAMNIERLNDQLQHVKSTLAGFVDAKRQFDTRSAEVREETRVFCLAVNAFEAATSRRLAFSPAAPRRRAKATDFIRIDDGEVARDGLTVDRELLPADLKYFLTNGSPPASTHWLAKRVGSGASEILSRSAAYFQG
jgi:tetratricopeptide (TPR) repeat protein